MSLPKFSTRLVPVAARKVGVRVQAAAKPRAAIQKPVVASARKLAPRDEAETLILDIAKRRARIAEDFYEIGVALNRLSSRPLYTALGFANFDALLKKRRIMSRVQAMKLITVSQAFDEKQALSLGVEKAYALVRYAAATPAPDLARSLASTNTMIGGQAVRAISAKELRDVTKRIVSGGSLTGVAPDDHDLKDARKTARALQKKLRADGARSAKVRAHRQGAGVELRIDMDVADAGALLG